MKEKARCPLVSVFVKGMRKVLVSETEIGSKAEWVVLHCRPFVIVLSDKSNVNTVTTKAALRRAD